MFCFPFLTTLQTFGGIRKAFPQSICLRSILFNIIKSSPDFSESTPEEKEGGGKSSLLILNIGILFFQDSPSPLSIQWETSHLGAKVAFLIASFPPYKCLWLLEVLFFLDPLFPSLPREAYILAEKKAPFTQTGILFYFTLCSFNRCFVFRSRWTTDLANTVIPMPWRDSTGCIAGNTFFIKSLWVLWIPFPSRGGQNVLGSTHLAAILPGVWLHLSVRK